MDFILFNAAVAVYILYLGFSARRYLHMLQLNSYMNQRYLKWFRNSFAAETGVTTLLPVIPLLLLALGLQIAFAAVWVAAFAVLILAGKKSKEKKKFVLTARVKRLLATMAVLWIAIYAAALILYPLLSPTGLLLLFTMLYIAGGLKIIYVIAANTLNTPIEKLINLHYYNDAKRILDQDKKLKIIGITGSYGKTSSKYILNSILSAKYNVLMTPESYNTFMGVIRTIRERLKPMHEVFIVEMGAKLKGDIEEICRLVKPGYGLLTSIGHQHLETFKTIENIVRTKFELIDSVTSENGISFLNFENEYIRNNRPAGKYIGYGINNSALDYWAEDVVYDSRGLGFTLCDAGGGRLPLKTRLLGLHNVLNIVSACAIAMELGVTADEICYAVRQIQPVPHRLELKGSASGITVIDDAYNSNPEGAKEAVNVLGKFASPMRILVTPGFVELGDKEREYHLELGRQAAASCDYIILVGVKRSEPILEGVLGSGYPRDRVFVARNLAAALEKMNEVAVPGSVVLFENDLPDNYEE